MSMEDALKTHRNPDGTVYNGQNDASGFTGPDPSGGTSSGRGQTGQAPDLTEDQGSAGAGAQKQGMMGKLKSRSFTSFCYRYLYQADLIKTFSH